MGFWCNGLGWAGWGGLGIAGPLLSLLLFAGALVLLGVGMAWLVRQFSRSPAAAEAEGEPLAIALRRLATGEISVAEFEEIRDRLRS